jgi:hypothetical protein
MVKRVGVIIDIGPTDNYNIAWTWYCGGWAIVIRIVIRVKSPSIRVVPSLRCICIVIIDVDVTAVIDCRRACKASCGTCRVVRICIERKACAWKCCTC